MAKNEGLYQLPNGDWFDPNQVTSVKVLPPIDKVVAPGRFPWRVIVETRGITTYYVPCGDRHHAEAARDLIAGVVNGDITVIGRRLNIAGFPDDSTEN